MINNWKDSDELLDNKLKFFIKEYECGLKSLEEIAIEKDVDLKVLKKYVTRHNIKINPFYKKSIKKGEDALNNLQLISKNDPEAGVIIDKFFEDKIPEMKNIAGNLANNILEKTSQIVNNSDCLETLSEASNILKRVSDALGLFPKTPAIAIQNNVSANAQSVKQESNPAEDMKIKIEFVKPPGYDEEEEIEDLI